MIATPLIHQQSIKVNLPDETPRPQDQSERPRVETISITADGQYLWNESLMSLTEIGSLLEAAGRDPEPPVIANSGDRDAAYGTIMEVVDRIESANLKSIDLNTRARGR